MKSFKSVVVVLSLLFAVPAFSAHCPADMKKIDAALSVGTKLTAAEIDAVKKLRMEGEELHKAGKHGESVEVLGKAMKMLGIE